MAKIMEGDRKMLREKAALLKWTFAEITNRPAHWSIMSSNEGPVF